MTRPPICRVNDDEFPVVQTMIGSYFMLQPWDTCESDATAQKHYNGTKESKFRKIIPNRTSTTTALLDKMQECMPLTTWL